MFTKLIIEFTTYDGFICCEDIVIQLKFAVNLTFFVPIYNAFKYIPSLFDVMFIFFLRCPGNVFFQHTSEYDLTCFDIFILNFISGSINFHTF